MYPQLIAGVELLRRVEGLRHSRRRFPIEPLSATLPSDGRAGSPGILDTRRNFALACALSALAGYVDGIGYLYLGGLFVSFMSGNSTRMGVSLAQGHWLDAAEAFGLIALFVIGAAAGSLIVLGRGAHRQPWVLLVEALLLAAAALCYGFGLSRVAVAAIVLAMGLENAVFQIHGG